MKHPGLNRRKDEQNPHGETIKLYWKKISMNASIYYVNGWEAGIIEAVGSPRKITNPFGNQYLIHS